MKSGTMVERRDQVLIGRLSLEDCAASTFFNRCPSTNGPFFNERDILGFSADLLAITTLHDHGVRALVLAGPITLGELAPRRNRMPLGAGSTLSAAMRVVDRVHRHPAHRRADSAPAHRAGLAELAQIVLLVADLADRGPALEQNLSDLAGAQPDLGVASLARQQLHRGAGRARQLRAFARHHLDAMNGRAHRDIAQRERVADPDRRFLSALDLGPDAQAARGDDVTALAVGVTQQRQMGGAVWIVFDALDLGDDAVLVATEIDHAVMLLVPAALVAGRDATKVVAAGPPDLALGQRGQRPSFVKIGTDDLDQSAPPRGSGLDLDQRHLLHLFPEIDFLAGLQTNVGLAQVAAPAGRAPELLFLAAPVQDLHLVDLHLEQQLHRRLDLLASGVLDNFERDLVV